MDGAEELRIDEGRAGGCTLWVRAQPGAKRSGLRGVRNARLEVALRSPPERGRANEELLALLAAALDLRPRALTLISGERSRDKRVLVPLSPAELRARLGV